MEVKNVYLVLKIIAYIAIITLSWVTGVAIAKTYIDRVKELNEIERFLNYLYNDISYISKPLPEAIDDIKNKIRYPIRNFLSDFEYNLSLKTMKIDECWEKSLDNNQQKLNLKKDDKEIVLYIGRQLGATDKSTQLKNLEFVISKIKNQVKLAEVEREKNSKLYSTIGLMAGILITIILI